MTLWNIIGSILIGPLKLLFEFIFSLAYEIIDHPGYAIIILSLAMNILVLPLYRRADDIQIAARDTENKLKDVVTHIKKTFSGDERMMILQTYYRQNHYNPLSVLSGSLSLMLEIPFFMAAYQFLSGVEAFKGVSFGPITDLSVPDGLLVIGSVSINLLPVIMTLVNVISSSLYLKGFPLKTKIQLYGMALFFLVFLYNSPAALVFYWTLNNTFSLFKTLFYRIKNSRLILNILLALAGAGLIWQGTGIQGPWDAALVMGIGLVAQLPWILSLLKKRPARDRKKAVPAPKTAHFILGALFLTVLVGLLIPSAFVAASPQEYIDTGYFYNPIWYVVQTFCYAAGAFMVWLGVFYWLANPAGKVVFARLVWILSGVALVNYMFFGTRLGVLSPDLHYGSGLNFALLEHLINIGVMLAVIGIFWLLFQKCRRAIPMILLVGTIALTGMGGLNAVKIANSARNTLEQINSSPEKLPSFSFSKEGQNVAVIMLDRGFGPFIPYLMEENPELKKQFDGFTYYENTLSYGGFTNFGTPPLYGGYDYTPVKMNQRDTELLEDKHNEALKVVPTILAKEDYNVTVIDPSYAGYQWLPDISIYDDLEGVNAFLASGKFNDLETRIQTVNERKRNFFFFSLMKALPVSLQGPIYNDGAYHAIPTDFADTSKVSPSFMNAYNVLKNLSNITNITDDGKNNYMFLRSMATHEPVVLQEPTFEPSSQVNNSTYYPAEGKTITAGDQSYLLDTENKIAHYHINMSSLMQLGDWFDSLREAGVYDNTRIIVVSDHGRNLKIFDEASYTLHNTEYYRPMLLVKDFNAKGFTTSEEFMTNGDVPSLSLEGLVENPVNPYTGNPIDMSGKEGEQYVLLSYAWEVGKNNGYQFLPSNWASVSKNVNDKNNWTFYQGASTFPPETK